MSECEFQNVSEVAVHQRCSNIAHNVKTLCDEGQLHEALALLHCINEKNARIPVEAYGYLFKGCIRLKALPEAKRLHEFIAIQGLENNSHVGSSVVNMLVKCGSLSEAVDLFKRLPKRTVLSWTAIIGGYSMAGQCAEALQLYQDMREQGVKPNKYTLIYVLKACASLGNLEAGQRLHAEAVQRGFIADVFVATTIVDMYMKCGSAENAQKVFDKILERNVWLWNVAIGGYAQLRLGEQALQLYARMREEDDVVPDNWTFVAVLKAQGTLAGMEADVTIGGCHRIKLDSLQKAKHIHAEMGKADYQSDVFVRTALLDLYIKCGSMLDAWNVFDGLHERDVVSWNAFISGYAEHQEGKKALQLYAQMQEEGVMPNSWAYVSALKACSSLATSDKEILFAGQKVKFATLEKGRVIHEAIHKSGHLRDAFIATTLVDMYANCGSIVDAWCIFNSVCLQSVGEWNAMVTACVKQELGDRALELYAQMLETGMMPDNRTFISVLQACSCLAAAEKSTHVDGQLIKIAALQTGKVLHAELVRNGAAVDVFVATTLVDMYVKCGSMVDAQYVYDQSDRRDPVLCNAMIAAFADCKQGDKALELFTSIQDEGITPTVSIFISALKACGSLHPSTDLSASRRGTSELKQLQKLEKIHAELCRMGYESDPAVGATLVDMYAKCGSVARARHVFDMLPQRSVIAWNAMIKGYAEDGQESEALQLFARLKEEGIVPNSWIYVSVLKACISLADKESESVIDGQLVKSAALEQGKVIHAETRKHGYDSYIFVATSLVNMYAKCGSIANAQLVFDTLSQRDKVSWNVMIAGYAELEQDDKAMQLYSDMRQAGVTPDEVTFIFLFKACSSRGALTACRRLHSDLVSCGVELTHNLANTLIHAYGRSGSMELACEVFDRLSNPSVVSWNALMAGYARQGKAEMTLQCYDEMQVSGKKPDAVTFLCLLTACSHAGILDKGLQYFASMGMDYGIPATREHYSSVVDLLGRAGMLQQAEDVILRMPVEPDLPIWGALLCACRSFGNLELGRRAFDKCVSIDPTKSSAYMLMSNIYARNGMPEEARRIDEMRGSAGAWKQPGESWIAHGDKLDMFVVGDTTHHGLAAILATVEDLNAQLRAC